MQRFHFDVTDSTNLQARLLAAEHPAERLLVTAAQQSAGRGRHGRQWQSPVGGAWMSLVWPLAKQPAAYSAASLAVGMGVLRALDEMAAPAASPFSIKWPNDILAAESKVAGVLCECVGVASMGVLIIGVGVNVDFDPALLGNGLRRPATTLREALGKSVSVDNVVEAVSHSLFVAMEAFEAEGLSPGLLGAIRSRMACIGAWRRCSTTAGPIRGRVAGVDDQGRLLLDAPSGQVACSAGELLEDDRAD